MEKFLFRNVKIWLVLFLLVLGMIGSVLFSSLVVHRMQGGNKLPGLSGMALEVARFPITVVNLIGGEQKIDMHEMTDRFQGEPGGFSFFEGASERHYVLLSRYDGDIGASVVELIREGEAEVLHRWVFDDADALAFDSQNPFIIQPNQSQSNTRRIVHPWLTEDGSLYAHSHFGAMYLFGHCGEVDWVNAEFQYHHSLERAADGTYWSVGTTTPDIQGQGLDSTFRDNRAIQLSPEGEVLFDKSVMEILEKAGLLNLTYDYDTYQRDPIHLNDIQPVYTDGNVAKRGDLYLSLGHLNMAMLYRPSTDELVWWTQDYMMHQHDIDIIGPDTIQLFDNRRKTGPDGQPMTISNNEMLRFDLPNRTGKPFMTEQMASLDVKTQNQGLADVIEGSGIMMEDTNAGRLVKFNDTGELDWTYLNRSNNGRVWTLNWSRYLPKDVGDQALEALRISQCKN
ncbi:MAG: arylsulfotransferase family protein [Paracoccaceae bacterium]